MCVMLRKCNKGVVVVVVVVVVTPAVLVCDKHLLRGRPGQSVHKKMFI